MVVTLEPKESFQKNPDAVTGFRASVDSPMFKEGVHKAITEFVLKYHPTAEELEGVRRFLAVLLNMGEKEDPLPKPSLIKSIEDFMPKPKQK
jgi:hypothetical protein